MLRFFCVLWLHIYLIKSKCFGRGFSVFECKIGKIPDCLLFSSNRLVCHAFRLRLMAWSSLFWWVCLCDRMGTYGLVLGCNGLMIIIFSRHYISLLNKSKGISFFRLQNLLSINQNLLDSPNSMLILLMLTITLREKNPGPITNFFRINKTLVIIFLIIFIMINILIQNRIS